jgi:hypothetical protein
MRNCDAVIVNYNAGTLLTESVRSVLAEGGSMSFRVERSDFISSWAERTDELADA